MFHTVPMEKYDLGEHQKLQSAMPMLWTVQNLATIFDFR